MIAAATTVCIVLVCLAVYQVLLTGGFVVNTRARPLREVADADLPPIAVLMAMRGADPDLAEGLRRLMRQDYPDYELRVVVDSEQDPAWPIAHSVVEETGSTNVRIDPLRSRPDNCSLHCASLVQLAEELDDGRQVFVLADSDVVGHERWLRELVGPIAAGEADATSGNRWYMPPQGRVGSLVRYVWNAAALLSMYWFRIPWGGTFAGRTSDLRSSGLVDRWRKALAVDAPIYNCWRSVESRSRFVPSLIMINREECGFAANFVFICRQLLWTRLYQPASFWWPIVVHAFVTSASLAAAVALTVVGLVVTSWATVAWSAGGLAAYLAAMGLSLTLLEYRVARIARERGERAAWISPAVLAKLILVIPLTQCVHMAAVLTVLLRNQIDWRGVTYEIRGSYDVRLVADRPVDSGKPLNSI
jgi:hypothetical protein